MQADQLGLHGRIERLGHLGRPIARTPEQLDVSGARQIGPVAEPWARKLEVTVEAGCICEREHRGTPCAVFVEVPAVGNRTGHLLSYEIDQVLGVHGARVTAAKGVA